MKDFNDYVKENGVPSPNGQNSNGRNYNGQNYNGQNYNANYSNGNYASSGYNGNNAGGNPPLDMANILSALAGRFEGRSEQDIISAIIAEAEKNRRNGTLTDADLDGFENSVAPMLDRKQRAKLSRVVAYLKRIR